MTIRIEIGRGDSDARMVSGQAERRRTILEPPLAFVQQEDVTNPGRPHDGRGHVEIEFAVTIGVECGHASPEASTNPADHGLWPDKIGRLDPSIPIGKFHLQRAPRLKSRGSRLGCLGEFCFREGIQDAGILAHLAVNLGGRVSGSGYRLQAVGIDLLPALQDVLLLRGITRHPVGERQLVDCRRQVGIEFGRLGVESDLLPGLIGPRRPRGVGGIRHGTPQPVPSGRIVGIDLGHPLEMAIGVAKIPLLLQDDPATEMGVGIVRVAIQDSRQERQGLVEIAQGRVCSRLLSFLRLHSGVVQERDGQVDRAGDPARGAVPDLFEGLDRLRILILLHEAQTLEVPGHHGPQLAGRDLVLEWPRSRLGRARLRGGCKARVRLGLVVRLACGQRQ